MAKQINIRNMRDFTKYYVDLEKTAWGKKRVCMYPGCKNEAIGSHILQENGMLDTISTNGHLYEVKVEIFQGGTFWKLIGKNKAFKFPGFCNDHDRNIFKDIETKGKPIDFDSYRSKLLFSYRAVCHEVRKMKFLYEIFNNLCQETIFRIPEAERERLAECKWQREFAQVQYENFVFTKTAIENDLNNNTENFHFVIKRLPKFEIISSVAYNFESPARVRQRMHNNRKTSPIVLTIVPDMDESVFIIGHYRNDTNVCQKYFDKLSSYTTNEMLQELTFIFLGNLDHWVCSHSFHDQSLVPNDNFIKTLKNNYIYHSIPFTREDIAGINLFKTS